MARSMHLYRPQRTRAELLAKTTVAREPLVNEIVERLALWTSGASRQHYLLIGPRGIGKTHLLRLVEHRLRSNPELEARWTPIVLAEDIYSITGTTDLLLEMLRILGEERGVPEAAEVYQAVRHDDDDARVCDRCLDAFRHYHRTSGRGVLLMIENLDRLLERQIRDRAESHRLRRILLEEDWLVAICTSPTYLNAVTNEEDPFFEFFRIQALAELTAAQQEEMLRRMAAAEGNTAFDAYLGELRSRLRALYHFTGGNPRLTVMLYDLLAHKKVGSVRSELDLLLDQLTPFYQDRMKEISELEAKVLEVMTLLPEGCTPAELALEARIPAKNVRATLTRLERAGYIRREERRHKRTVYIVPERFFRIWHQMNHSRAARGRIQYLLEFFSSWYASREERDRVWDELANAFGQGIAEGDEERVADIAEYMNYVAAVSEGSERFERGFERLRRVARTGHRTDIIGELAALDLEHEGEGDYFLHKGYFLATELGRHEAALEAFQSAAELKRDDLVAYYNRAFALERLGRVEDARMAYGETAALLVTKMDGGSVAHIQPLLIRVLHKAADPQLIRIAAGLLGRLAELSMTGEITAILQNADTPWRRQCCAQALGLLGSVGSSKALIRCLKDSSVGVRACSAAALGRIGSRDAAKPLSRAVDDAESIVRSSAIAALSRIGIPDTDLLLMRALKDPVSHVRAAAVAALSRMGAQDCEQLFMSALADRAIDVRCSAAAALGRIRSANAVQPLISAMKGPAERLRGAAASALGRIGSLDAIPPLIQILEDDTQPDIRAIAAAALGRVGDPKAVEALLTALEDPVDRVNGTAAAALGRIAELISWHAMPRAARGIPRAVRILTHLPNRPKKLDLPRVLQMLLRAAYRSADLELIHQTIREILAVGGGKPSWAPYEIALGYLGSNRDPAVLERQQPEMREAVLLVVGLFDEGVQAAEKERTQKQKHRIHEVGQRIEQSLQRPSRTQDPVVPASRGFPLPARRGQWPH